MYMYKMLCCPVIVQFRKHEKVLAEGRHSKVASARTPCCKDASFSWLLKFLDIFRFWSGWCLVIFVFTVVFVHTFYVRNSNHRLVFVLCWELCFVSLH